MKCALSALGPWHVTSQGSPKTFPSGQQAAVGGGGGGGGTLGIIVGLCQGGLAEFELSARWSKESKEKRARSRSGAENAAKNRGSPGGLTPSRCEFRSRRYPGDVLKCFVGSRRLFRRCCELAVLQSTEEKLAACCPHDPARLSRAPDSLWRRLTSGRGGRGW